MRKKCISAVALLLALILPLAGCSADKAEKQSAVGFYLDTVIMLTAYVDDVQVLNDALEECGRYERMLSRTVEGSDVWRINHAKGEAVEVSDETIDILQTARQVSQMSGGVFDVTIAPVSTLWDFTSGAKVLPDADEMQSKKQTIVWLK